MTVSSATNKVQYNGNGSTTVFAYTFKIFNQNDLTVIVRSAIGTETVKTITTHYTVSGVGGSGGGNVTMLTAPASGETLTVLREQDLIQELDLVENDPFPAQSLEDALDKLTFMVQQHSEEIDRTIKASRTNTIASTEFTVSAADRANKIFAFDSAGELSVTQELGTYRGNWATATAFAQRDIVKDTSNNNIYIVVTAHTSSGALPISSNVDVAKWALIVDAAAATGGSFGDGTAALPSITNTGDTNTGVFFPAADTVAVSTAGTQRVTVDSSGNVGIATSLPDYKLTVQSTATSAGFGRDIVRRAGEQTNFHRTSLVYNDSGSASGAFGSFASGIYHEWAGAFAVSGGLTFATNHANAGPITFATVDTEAMRITSSGNVGIGTTSPTTKLSIEGALNFSAVVATPAVSASIYSPSASQLAFGTASTEAMRITATGLVGIGTSSPITPLHVTGASTTTGVVYKAQPAQTSKAAAATLTIAELLTGIVQYTGAVATLTLPTGTLIEGGLPATFPTDMSFDVSFINTGAALLTIGTAASLTLVGTMTVATATSAMLRFRKTAANTYTVYRIS